MLSNDEPEKNEVKKSMTSSRHASLVHHYLAWFVLFHFMLHWFFLTGHGLYCFTSCFIGSSLMDMVCVVSRHPSPVHPYWA
jgi:hypothetical protein